MRERQGGRDYDKIECQRHEDAAKVAKEANAKYLILNHISSRFLPRDLENLLKEAKKVFPHVFVAKDFSSYQWKNGQLIDLSAKNL